MPTWSEPPLKALWTASTISQTLSMPLTASLVNRPSSSMLSCARSPPIWSHCVPNAANLALENVAQKTINYLPNLVKKCASHHTETSRRINPKCALSSCHSGQTPLYNLAGASPNNYNSKYLNEIQHEQNDFAILAYQKSFENVSLQVAAFSRYSSTLFAPDDAGDLIFTGLAGRIDRSIFSNGVQFDAS